MYTFVVWSWNSKNGGGGSGQLGNPPKYATDSKYLNWLTVDPQKNSTRPEYRVYRPLFYLFTLFYLIHITWKLGIGSLCASCTCCDLPAGPSSSLLTPLKSLPCRMGGPARQKPYTVTPRSAASFIHSRRVSQTRFPLRTSRCCSVSTEMLHNVVSALPHNNRFVRAVHSSNAVEVIEVIWLLIKLRYLSVSAIKCKSGTTASWLPLNQSVSRTVGWNADELITLITLSVTYSSESWVYWQNSQLRNTVISLPFR